MKRNCLVVPILTVVAFAALIAVIWLMPHHAFEGPADSLPLHNFADTLPIVVSMAVFGVAWNVDSCERSGNVVILACAIPAAGFIDFAHMLSRKGVPDFVTPASPAKAFSLRLSARLVAAVGLLAVISKPLFSFPGGRASSDMRLPAFG